MAQYRTLLAMMLTAFAIAALAAGCGDDDEDGSATPTNGSEATATPGGSNSDPAIETATEAGGGSDNTPTATTDGGSAAGLERVRAAAATLDQQTFDVVFEIQSNSMAGTFTFTSKPPDSLVGMNGTIDGKEGSYLIVTLDDFLYFCSDSDGQQACIKTKAGQAFPMQLPTLIDAGNLANQLANAPDMSIERTEGETIAGISADCYQFTSPNETGKVCIGDDMLLSYDGTYEGNPVSMKAAEYTGDPSSVEITVPDWPITDLSGLGN